MGLIGPTVMVDPDTKEINLVHPPTPPFYGLRSIDLFGALVVIACTALAATYKLPTVPVWKTCEATLAIYVVTFGLIFPILLGPRRKPKKDSKKKS